MLKLVVLSEGMTGRTLALTADKTTIGRTEDNTFPVAESSVSSHHCEVLLRGSEVLVRDLSSTNGTFINGEKVTESVLKPGQVLRLGQLVMRLESDAPAPSSKRPLDRTTVITGGVSLSDLDHTGQTDLFHPRGTGFSKRSNEGNRIFIIVAIIVGVVIGVMLVYVSRLAGK
jgi:predicted component of type VI protein secretion system